MRVYFITKKRCALKLNGIYIGITDMFERFIEMDLSDEIFAEIIPDENLQPLNFILNEEFFINPPTFATVYLLGGNFDGQNKNLCGFCGGAGCDALIYIDEFCDKSAELKVLAQTKFCNFIVTAYKQGTIKLCCERQPDYAQADFSQTGEGYGEFNANRFSDFNAYYHADFSEKEEVENASSSGGGAEIYTLSNRFENISFEEREMVQKRFLCVCGNGALAVISDGGKLVFLNDAENFEFLETLKVCVPFTTCTHAKAECEFAFNGESFELVKSVTVETNPIENSVKHFAFFESVLTCGNFAQYLSEELKEKAHALKEFLGDFCEVIVPHGKFFALHGDIPAAGLVFKRANNLFYVKYFAVEIQQGKITNIYEVE